MLYFSRQHRCCKVDRSSRVAVTTPFCENYRRLLELNFQPLTEVRPTVRTCLATFPKSLNAAEGQTALKREKRLIEPAVQTRRRYKIAQSSVVQVFAVCGASISARDR